jgi:mono/diheme cytochrome c family protein
MLKILKWVGIILGALVGLAVLAVVVLNVLTITRINRTYDVEVESITIPTDEASLARGEYLAQAICTECHGEDLAGELMFEEPSVAAIYGTNITPSGSGVGDYSDADYVRAIRHAVGPDGKPLVLMPAEVLVHWSEEDLGATIAYLKSLPAIENEVPDQEYSLMARTLLPTGTFGQIFPAEYIDHDLPFPEMPEIGLNAEYGEYMARVAICTDCHGDDMTGGPPPPCCPEYGEIPPAVHAAGWSTEEFLTGMTTGVTPGGRQLDGERMPVELFANFNDEDLEAVHLYLQTLTAQ